MNGLDPPTTRLQAKRIARGESPIPESPVRTRRRRSRQNQPQFGGPSVQLLLIFGLPVLVFVLNLFVGNSVSIKELLLQHEPALLLEKLNISCGTLLTSLQLISFWCAFHVLLERLLPADLEYGPPLSDRSVLPYRVNGHLALWVSLLLVSHGHVIAQWLQIIEPNKSGTLDHLAAVADLFMPLLCVACLFTGGLSLLLYLASFRRHLTAKEVPRGATGNCITDFWTGRELNPRIFPNSNFDLKFHCMMRPGLIGWITLNICFGAKQYTELGYVTPSLTLTILLQGVYVWDLLYHESTSLATSDISCQGLGYMLLFGYLVWVPFTNTLQTRYLLSQQSTQLSIVQLGAIVVLFAIGYSIFRLSSNQRNLFRKDPSDPRVQHLHSLQTSTGQQLLVSGWFGLARKINYSGDWLMGCSWCLLSGWGSIVPYFYAISFLLLLLHRAARDDTECSEKYGHDWKRYKKLVPYLFVPKVI